jgi:hypothetical protein
MASCPASKVPIPTSPARISDLGSGGWTLVDDNGTLDSTYGGLCRSVTNYLINGYTGLVQRRATDRSEGWTVHVVKVGVTSRLAERNLEGAFCAEDLRQGLR